MYYICKFRNNRWCISTTSFNDIDKAKKWLFDHYGQSTEYTIKFVVNGKIVK